MSQTVPASHVAAGEFKVRDTDTVYNTSHVACCTEWAEERNFTTQASHRAKCHSNLMRVTGCAVCVYERMTPAAQCHALCSPVANSQN